MKRKLTAILLKSTLMLLITVLYSCNKPTLIIDNTTTIFIEEIMKQDSIIVKYNNEYNDLNPLVYYAKMGWQLSMSNIPMNGEKNIAIRTADSIYINTPNVGSTNNYAYYFKFSADGLKLESQNFLLPPSNSSKKVFVKQ